MISGSEIGGEDGRVGDKQVGKPVWSNCLDGRDEDQRAFRL